MSKTENVYDAVSAVINKCREVPSYKCGVYASSVEFLEEAFNFAVNTIHDLNSIKGMMVRRTERKILFENHSVIEFLIADERVRGKRFDYALADSTISDEGKILRITVSVVSPKNILFVDTTRGGD